MSRILQRVARVPGEVRESDLWRTEPKCYEALHEEFRFEADLAADADNHLHPMWLGPGGLGADALATPWLYNVGFLNPPYSSTMIAAFLSYTIMQVQRTWITVVALVPDTPDTRWYQELQHAQEIRHIPHRVRYLKADGVTAAGAMFPSCVAVFRPQPGVRQPATPRHCTWSYR